MPIAVALFSLFALGEPAFAGRSGQQWTQGVARCEMVQTVLHDSAATAGHPTTADRASQSSFQYALSDLHRLAENGCDPRAVALGKELLPKIEKLQAAAAPGILATHFYECEKNPPTAEERIQSMNSSAQAIGDSEALFQAALQQLKGLDHDLQREAGEDPASRISVRGKIFSEGLSSEVSKRLEDEGYKGPAPADDSALALWRAGEALAKGYDDKTDDPMDELLEKDYCSARFDVAWAWASMELLSCDLSFSHDRMQTFASSFASGGLKQLRFCEQAAKGGAGSEADGSGEKPDHSDITGIGRH